MTNYNWPFGTLPFGLFGSNLDTRNLETYARTYSGHFWNMSIFDDSRAIWVLFRKWVVSENQSFLNEGAIITLLIGIVLGGEVPRLNHGPICFPNPKHLRGCYGPLKVKYHFLTLSQRIKTHLLLMYWIKNLSIGVSSGALLNVFWIFEYVTTGPFAGPFAGPLSVDFTHVQKVRQQFSAICILIFKSKTSIKV